MTYMVSTNFQMAVTPLFCLNTRLAFYDPDGYYFDNEGYDEFGGYYNRGYYVKPKRNYRHQKYEEEYDDYYEEDDMVRQYEMGDNHNDD